MGRKKKAVAEQTQNNPDEVFPNGAHFGMIQLPQDLNPKPSAQRIIQWANRGGALKVYVSENAYQRAECITWFDRLVRLSYQHSISKGQMTLCPIKGRIHWLRFSADFCQTRKGERINPETDAPEEK